MTRENTGQWLSNEVTIVSLGVASMDDRLVLFSDGDIGVAVFLLGHHGQT